MISSVIVPFALVASFVLVMMAEWVFDVDLGQYGVFPRKVSRLYGIFTYPFIHADWKHLLNNSTAILILGTMLYYFYRQVATKTLVWVCLMSGLWLWIGGRANFHIGASGIVYALFGFLFMSGVIRRHLKLMALSMLVVFLYGSLVWGILPIDHHISYEGHLFGLLAGVVVAVVYRNQGPQQPKYSWELVEEEEVPDWFPDPERKEEKNEPPSATEVRVTYVYRPKDEAADRS